MKIHKFGKKYQDLFKIKKNFTKENDLLLSKQKKIAKLYSKQPFRTLCKACNKKLIGNYFLNHGIKYIQCKNCSHLNGVYQDTIKFSDEIYLSGSVNYSKNYKSSDLKNFIFRQKKIYDPKANFLKKILKLQKNIKILDFGCGSGYFVSSLIDYGFKNVEGVELSNQQIDYGKNILSKLKKNKNLLKYCDRSRIYDFIKNTDANCITMIGVLEHLVDIPNFMKNVKKNKSIKYIYLCVPMFSLSCLIENSFLNIFNRHLGGGHTHLFTEKSLSNLMKNYNFTEIASWWFGTDIPDLYRSLLVNSHKNKSKGLKDILEKIKLLIDDLQLVLDKKKLSSQVHMVLKRK